MSDEELRAELAKQTKLLERIAENYPEIDSVQVFSGDSDTVAAGSSLTVTFILNWQNWKIRITELYADARSGCDYVWKFAGNTYTLNEVYLGLGQWAIEDTYHEITLIVENTGTSDVEVGYYIKGWAVKKR